MNKELIELIKKLPQGELKEAIAKLGFTIPEAKVKNPNHLRVKKPCVYKYHDVDVMHHYECIFCGAHDDILYKVDYLTKDTPPNGLSYKLDFICIKCKKQQKTEDI